MRIPSRRMAVCLQWCGVAVVAGWFILSWMGDVVPFMASLYCGTALALLAAGVLIRRYHDKE